MKNCLSNRKFENLLFVDVQIQGREATALFDTGAGMSVIARSLLDALDGVQKSEALSAGNNNGLVRTLPTAVISSVQIGDVRQIVFAVAVGFLLVTVFYRGGSLIPCILVHSAINTLGTFANDAGLTVQMQLLHIAALILITAAYTLILMRTLPEGGTKVEIQK